MKQKKKFIKYFILIITSFILLIFLFFVYSYIQGGKENYVPPKQEVSSDIEQVKSDLIKLSSSIESYYTINLSYPDSLSELIPEFIDKLPMDPLTEKNYNLKVYSDTLFEVSVIDASLYKLKEIKVRNGKVIQN